MRRFRFLSLFGFVLFVLFLFCLPAFMAKPDKDAELVLNGDFMHLIIEDSFTGTILLRGQEIRLRSQTVITGDIAIYGRDAWLTLEHQVTGNIAVHNEATASVDTLEVIGGSVFLEGTARYQDLKTINQDLYIDAENCVLDALQFVGGALTLKQNASLASLTIIEGDLEIMASDFDLPSLKEVKGSVILTETIPQNALASLRKIHGDLILDAPHISLQELEVGGALILTEKATHITLTDAKIHSIDLSIAKVSHVELKNVVFQNVYPLPSADLPFVLSGADHWTFENVLWPQGDHGPLVFTLVVASENVTFVDTSIPGDLVIEKGPFTLRGDDHRVEVQGALHLSHDASGVTFHQVHFSGPLHLGGSMTEHMPPYFSDCEIKNAVASIPSGTTFHNVRFALQVPLPIEIYDNRVVFKDCVFEEQTILAIHATDSVLLSFTEKNLGHFQGEATLQIKSPAESTILLKDMTFREKSTVQVTLGDRSVFRLESIHSEEDTSFHFQGRGIYQVYDTILQGSLLLEGPELYFEAMSSEFLGDLSILEGRAIFGQIALQEESPTSIGGALHIASKQEVCFFNTNFLSPTITLSHSAKRVRMTSVQFSADTSIEVFAGEGSPLLIVNSASVLLPVHLNRANTGTGDDLALWLRGTIEGNDKLLLQTIHATQSELGLNSLLKGVTFDFDLQGIRVVRGATIQGGVVQGTHRINGVSFEDTLFLGDTPILDEAPSTLVETEEEGILEPIDTARDAEEEDLPVLLEEEEEEDTTLIDEEDDLPGLIEEEEEDTSLLAEEEDLPGLLEEEEEDTTLITEEEDLPVLLEEEEEDLDQMDEEDDAVIATHADEDLYTLTITVRGEGLVEPLGATSVSHGSLVYLVVSSLEPWGFSAWLGEHGREVQKEEGPYYIKMDDHKEITAVFEKGLKELVLESVLYVGARGQAFDLTGTSPYPPGSRVQLKAVPETDEDAFLYWSTTAGDSADYFEDPMDRETIYTMPAVEAVVHAHFAKQSRPIETGTFHFDHLKFGEVISGQDGITVHYWDLSALHEGQELVFYFNAQNLPERFHIYYGDWEVLTAVFFSGWVSQTPEDFQDHADYPEGVTSHSDSLNVEPSSKISFRGDPGGKLTGFLHLVEGKHVLKVEIEGKEEGTWWNYMLDKTP